MYRVRQTETDANPRRIAANDKDLTYAEVLDLWTDETRADFREFFNAALLSFNADALPGTMAG